MLNRVFHLSSIWESFKSECAHLKVMFTNLKDPDSLIKSTAFSRGVDCYEYEKIHVCSFNFKNFIALLFHYT